MDNLSNRRRSRELALQVLFQTEYDSEIDLAKSLSYFQKQFEMSSIIHEYAEVLVLGITENKEKIDSTIKSLSLNWRFDRMALVDINIMRISIFELLFNNNEVPPKVIINESLEIAKKYSSSESSSFINGILDQIVKENNLTLE